MPTKVMQATTCHGDDDGGMMSGSTRQEKFVEWLFRLAAILMFFIAVYLLLRGDSTGGGVAGLIAFGLLAYQFFPFIEKLEIFGLKAELRQKIVEADQELTKLREVATALAGASILQLSWVGRWGAPSLSSTRSKLEEIERVLTNLKVPSEIITTVKEPYISMLCYDLVLVAYHTIRKAFMDYSSVAHRRLDEYTHGRSIDPDDREFHRLRTVAQSYSVESMPEFDPNEQQLTETRNRLLDIVRSGPIFEPDRSKLLQLLGEVEVLSRAVRESGKVTAEAISFLSQYGKGSDAKFNELFGANHSQTIATELK